MDRKDLDVTLYLVTDSSYHTEESLLRTVEEACKGGVTLVQLREKNKGGREYLDKAFKVKEITDRYNVPLIIDDRVDVALACDAAGVHVGSSDIPVAVARKLMGPDKIVGATAKTVEAAVKAYEDLYGITPLCTSLHAGLECGNFLLNNPKLDMISFGPTLRDVHTPKESMHIPAVDKCWNHLRRILEMMADEK